MLRSTISFLSLSVLCACVHTLGAEKEVRAEKITNDGTKELTASPNRRFTLRQSANLHGIAHYILLDELRKNKLVQWARGDGKLAQVRVTNSGITAATSIVETRSKLGNELRLSVRDSEGEILMSERFLSRVTSVDEPTSPSPIDIIALDSDDLIIFRIYDARISHDEVWKIFDVRARRWSGESVVHPPLAPGELGKICSVKTLDGLELCLVVWDVVPPKASPHHALTIINRDGLCVWNMADGPEFTLSGDHPSDVAEVEHRSDEWRIMLKENSPNGPRIGTVRYDDDRLRCSVDWQAR